MTIPLLCQTYELPYEIVKKLYEQLGLDTEEIIVDDFYNAVIFEPERVGDLKLLTKLYNADPRVVDPHNYLQKVFIEIPKGQKFRLEYSWDDMTTYVIYPKNEYWEIAD